MTRVSLIVVDEEGVRRPGRTLRAGDMIERTHYDHDRNVIEVHATQKRILPLWVKVRRWWEGWRR